MVLWVEDARVDVDLEIESTPMIGDTTSSFDPSLRGEQQDPYAFSIDT